MMNFIKNFSKKFKEEIVLEVLDELSGISLKERDLWSVSIFYEYMEGSDRFNCLSNHLVKAKSSYEAKGWIRYKIEKEGREIDKRTIMIACQKVTDKEIEEIVED